MNGNTSKTMSRVLRGQLCTGCGLCAGVSSGAIEMETVAPGYSRPKQIAPVDTQTEHAIATACPGNHIAPWEKDSRERDLYWGPYIQCLTGNANAPDVRHAGSSGGAISALAMHALEIGLVERVLHVTADPEKPTRNILKWSETPQQVIEDAGSRYASSSPLAEIETALSEGRKFLFIGKPCDISALRQLATTDARVDALVPVMISFFCGGIPSHNGADRIIRAMGLQPQDVNNFRYRGNGWPGLTRAETHNGLIGEMRYADSWGGHLSKEVQFRCKICPDAVGGVADIACADAWYGGEAGYPTFDELDGRSLILSRSQVGEKLLESAVTSGDMSVENLPISEVNLMQPSQARRKRLVSARVLACSLMLQPSPAMDGLDVNLASKRAVLKEKLKNLLGTMRRIGMNKR